jgi:hypothetical protein
VAAGFSVDADFAAALREALLGADFGTDDAAAGVDFAVDFAAVGTLAAGFLADGVAFALGARDAAGVTGGVGIDGVEPSELFVAMGTL